MIVALLKSASVRARAGTVESKLRQLVNKLEHVESLILAHPFIKGFDQTLYCLNEDEVRQSASGDPSEAVLRRKKSDMEGKEGASVIYTSTFYVGLAVEPKRRTPTQLFGTRIVENLCESL